MEGLGFGPLKTPRGLDHFVDDFTGPFDDERARFMGNDFGVRDAEAPLGVNGRELGDDGGFLPLDSLEHGDQLAHRREHRVVGLIRFHVGSVSAKSLFAADVGLADPYRRPQGSEA